MLAVVESNGPETATELSSAQNASTTNSEVTQETRHHKLNANRSDNFCDTSKNRDDKKCEQSEVVDSLEIANNYSNSLQDFKSDSMEYFQSSDLKNAHESDGAEYCLKEPGQGTRSFHELNLTMTLRPGDQSHASSKALCDSKTASAVGAQNSATGSDVSAAALDERKSSRSNVLRVIPETSEASPTRPASLQIKTTAKPLNYNSSFDTNGQLIRSVKSSEKDNAMSDKIAMPILNVMSTKCQSNVVVKSEQNKSVISPDKGGTIGQNAVRPTRPALKMGSGLETYEYSFGSINNGSTAALRTTTTTNSDNNDRDSNNKELMCFNPSDKCNPARRPISRLPTISTRHSSLSSSSLKPRQRR